MDFYELLCIPLKPIWMIHQVKKPDKNKAYPSIILLLQYIVNLLVNHVHFKGI